MIQSLFTGLSGLIAHQKALDTTSNNIANFNNKDYHKQRVIFSNNPGIDRVNLEIGTGVHISNIERIKDENLFKKMNSENESNEYYKKQFFDLDSLDNSLNQETLTGLYDNFFEALNNQVNNPSNDLLKDISLREGNKLQERAKEIIKVFKEHIIKNEEDLKLKESEIELNIKEVENLNLKIAEREAGGNIKVNELKDLRDGLIKNNSLLIGEIEGIKSSNNIMNRINNSFMESFEDIYKDVEEFKNSRMSNDKAKELLNKQETIKTKHNALFININNMRNNSEVMYKTSFGILMSTKERYTEISSINLDEEMVNQIRFQKAYEANAILIRTADEILKTTLDMKR